MRLLEKEFGFVVCFVVTLLLSAVLELSGVWWTLLIAGFVGGFLAKKTVKAVAAGFLGVLIGWALYFLAFWLIAPAATSLAFSTASLFVILTLVLGAVLGALSAVIGALASMLMYTRPEIGIQQKQEDTTKNAE